VRKIRSSTPSSDYLKSDLFDPKENRARQKARHLLRIQGNHHHLTERLKAAGLDRRILTVDAGNRAKVMPMSAPISTPIIRPRSRRTITTSSSPPKSSPRA
jgi:hypothetical protein